MRRVFLSLIVIVCIPFAGMGQAQDRISESSPKGLPPDAKVLVIFVDSLRPDIVEAMVKKNKLPNIQKLFFDKDLD